MPTIAELGQRVKAKYPGKYDDLPDDELGRKVKAKYPGSYADFTEAPVAPPRAVGPAGGYLEGPSRYKENFGGDPLNYIPVTPYNIPLGRAIDAFPNMGGAVFGTVGGVPGAAIGGGAMDMLRRSLRGLPIDLRASGREGVKQGLLQGAGAALGAGSVLASKTIGPAASLAERMASRPLARGLGRLLPFGGYAARGMGGAIAGVALPIAGKAAVRVATDPRTERFLGSMAFRSFARHFPQAANQIVQQLTAPQE